MSVLRAVPGTAQAVLAALGETLSGRGKAFVPVPGEESLARRVMAAARPDLPLETACAVVLPTSGSTGEPKAVLLSAGALRASAAAAAELTGERRYAAIVPTQLGRLLETAPGALRSFDAVLVGGAATPPALLARVRDAGVRVVTTYGMTETGGGCVYDGVPLDGVT